MTQTMTVLAGHPYFRFAEPSVWQLNGKWIVKWRDFRAMSIDAEFATESKARTFASEVTRPPLLVCDDGWEDIADLDVYWRQLALDYPKETKQ